MCVTVCVCVCSHLCLPLSLRIAPWPRCGSSFRCGCFASSSPSPCSLLGRLGETSRGRVSAIVCSSAARPSRWTRLNTVATISFHNLLFSYKFHFHYPSETNKCILLVGVYKRCFSGKFTCTCILIIKPAQLRGFKLGCIIYIAH